MIDFGGSRLEMAKDIIRKSCVEETIIIPFAGNKEPTIVYPKMSHVLDTITQPHTDGTALYDLCMSVVMDSTNNYRDIVILTDGMDNCSHISLKTITEVMQQHGVTVNIISINSERDSVLWKSLVLDSVFTIKNEQPLKSDLLYQTNKTGGQWVKCIDKNEIGRVVKQITTISSRPYKRRKTQQSTEGVYDKFKHYYLTVD